MMIRIYLLIAMTGLVIAGCSSETQAPVGSRITYGLTFEAAGLDPHRNQSTEIGVVLRQIYDTLVYRHPTTGEIVPGLASEWSIDADNRAYTFTLRQDVVFHDGTRLDAAAVGANFDRIISPEVASQQARALIGPYAGYEIVDPFTIRLLLTEPHAPFLDALSQFYLGIGSPAAFGEYSVNRYQFHQVGTGPYYLLKYTPGIEIVLRKNAAYTWGPEFYDTEATGPDEIVYRFVTEPEARADALQSGDVQIIGQLPPVDARSLSGNSLVRLLPTRIPGHPVHFIMNTERYPTDNAVVRQALLHATNRSAIADVVFQGFAPVAWGPLSANSLYYSRDVIGIYDYNVQQARALLSSIGFDDLDQDGFLDAGEGALEITLLVPSASAYAQIAQLLEAQWREIGVRVIVQQVPGFSGVREVAQNGAYNLIAYEAWGYDPIILNDVFLTGAAHHYTNYTNPELDNALIVAARESSPGTRRQFYGQIQQFIMLQALILPISDYVALNATNTTIEQLQYANGWYPLMRNVVITQ